MSVSVDAALAALAPLDTRWLERRIGQYVESDNLAAVLGTYLREMEPVRAALAELARVLDLDTAQGEALSLIGRRMGFPRTHCVSQSRPVFGFPRPNGPLPGEPEIGDLGDPATVWAGSEAVGVGSITINDDAAYRRFLKARAVQLRSDYTVAALLRACVALFGPGVEILGDTDRTVVVVLPARLDATARLWRPLYPRVLPIPPCVSVRFHERDPSLDLFGFGAGWAPLFEVQPARITNADGSPLVTASGDTLVADVAVTTGEWLNPVDWDADT